MTLLGAVGSYVGGVKDAASHEGLRRDLFRFVQWFGAEKALSELGPPDIGEYAERAGGSSATSVVAEHLQVVKGFLSDARKKGLIDQNLAPHIRIRKSRGSAGRARAFADQGVQLTPEGHAQLQSQLEALKAERGPLAVQIRTAAADKDVRENVPLEAAREQLGLVESRIATIENTLKSAVIMDAAQRERAAKVALGAEVTVKDLSTGRQTVNTLVSSIESNPTEGKISDVSPLGKALMGRSVGQDVEVATPRGKVLYRILRVSR